MPSIASVARSHGAIVIEDACHAVGGQFKHDNKVWNVGGHPWADMTTFSFHPVKTMTTGEGGMLVTDNDDYAAAARALRTHGTTREQEDFVGLGAEQLNEQGPWYYEMQQLGHNFRITDFQCALGASQLSRLPDAVTRRREMVNQYNQAFANLDFVSTPALRNPADKDLTSWHLYTLQVDFEALAVTRSAFMKALLDRGIGTQVLYIPVHLQPWYRKAYEYAAGKCPNAEAFYRQSISLPLYAGMTPNDVVQVQSKLCESLRRLISLVAMS